MSRLTKDEEDLIAALREGRGIIINCDFEFGIQVSENDDGRFTIGINPSPQVSADTPAWVQIMRRTVQNWSAILDSSAARRLH